MNSTDDSTFDFVDVLILGAGGSGMMCAIEAAKRGRKVVILDHARKLGGKILISGGGRCNFTNQGATPAHYVSRNPHFCKSALSRYQPQAFIELVKSYGIAFHEKKLGQLFCDGSAQNIIQMLEQECSRWGVKILLGCKIESVSKSPSLADPHRFQVNASAGNFRCRSLVVATGGLSLPKLGATGLGYELARQFGLSIADTAPALDGFTLGEHEINPRGELAGLSLDCTIQCNHLVFRENILFTHQGLSGPAALQASLHWNPGDPIQIDLLPDLDAFEWFLEKKREGSRATLVNLLANLLPSRFAAQFSGLYFSSSLPLPQLSEKKLQQFCEKLHRWELFPTGTVGYSKAEVTRGGVDTNEISSKTFEAHRVLGLYFIGEVLDVTGWLGGYNFQWAWASGWAAGQAV